jgi:cytochrome c-type biogenesis protein CcmE
MVNSSATNTASGNLGWRKNLKYLVGLGIMVAAVLFLVLSSANSTLVYFITPSEYAKDEAQYQGRTVRLGGKVVEESVKFNKTTLALAFTVTDGTTSYPVTHIGTPPELFQPGEYVTIEGKFTGAGNNASFNSSILLVKHSEEYSAPKAGETPNFKKLIEDTQ